MEVHFYEKPGCINNTKQKNLLIEKGHRVQSFDILNQEWTEDSLMPFIENRSVNEWFNQSAPRIKNGEINPDVFNEETAIKALIIDHYLIKRPLIWANGKFACGFDSELANDLLAGATVSHLLNCPKTDSQNSCDKRRDV